MNSLKNPPDDWAMSDKILDHIFGALQRFTEAHCKDISAHYGYSYFTRSIGPIRLYSFYDPYSEIGSVEVLVGSRAVLLISFCMDAFYDGDQPFYTVEVPNFLGYRIYKLAVKHYVACAQEYRCHTC